MSNLFQQIAQIISEFPFPERETIAARFAKELQKTNPGFSQERFKRERQMNFTKQECKDLLEAIEVLQEELCVGEEFPEGTELWNRLEALADRINEYRRNL